MKKKFPLTLAVALLPFAAPLTMQAEGEKPGGAGAVEFTCASWDDLPYPELFYRRGGEHLPLKISAGQRSQAYPLKGAGMLELCIRKGDPSDEPVEYEKVGAAPLPEGVRRMLFLIESKKDANGLPLQLLGMDDSLETFPAGSFRFINRTPDQLRIEFGGTVCQLPPEAIKVVVPETPAADGFLSVVIKDGEGQMILENRFFTQPTARELVVISPPAGGKTGLSIKSLTEIVPVSPLPVKKPAPRK